MVWGLFYFLLWVLAVVAVVLVWLAIVVHCLFVSVVDASCRLLFVVVGLLLLLPCCWLLTVLGCRCCC